MRLFPLAIVAGAVLGAVPPEPVQAAPVRARELLPEKLEALDSAVQRHIEAGRLPGVVLWIERRGEAHRRAFGWKTLVPTVTPMSEETLFDVASLTKVVATTPAIMALVEDGRLDLAAPVATYIPQFKGDGREAVTVQLLMTHTSGLPPGIRFEKSAPWSGYDEGISRACREPLSSVPGSQFVYSDINFILLGEIVRRVSGSGLDEFCSARVFQPLGMCETGFRPSAGLLERVAPTTVEGNRPLRGVVHDPTSRRMGRVTGHAGLFTSSRDLARYCRMLMNRGILDGVRVFKEETVARMTRVQTAPEMEARRGLGWDLQSRFSHQRGDYFPEGSFGHTGWTGPSLWIDPASQTFVIFLANRNHPTEAGSTGRLRHRIGTLAAEAAAGWQEIAFPGFVLPVPRSTGENLPVLASRRGPVMNGIDVLKKRGFKEVRGRRVGLITNHTGIDRNRRPTIDLLAEAPGVKLTALFSPEHGIRGLLDRSKIDDSKDEATGLPVFSLYGERRAPTAEQLAMVDILVFDIQDIGCRFYTYVSTMVLAMEAAAKAGKKFLVLDRVNPIGGRQVGGPLREGPNSFTAAHRIPVRHAMTAGELARMVVAERGWKLDLQVVRCENWTRDDLFDETGLPWINPSPNMRSLTAALLYPGVGLLEFTNLSVGRGTDSPFELVGAPWIDDAALSRAINDAAVPGVRALPVTFTPTASVFKGERCRGIRLIVTNRDTLDSPGLGAALGSALCRLHRDQYKTTALDKLLCHPKSAGAIRAGRPPEEIRGRWRSDERAFVLRRRPHLLY